MKITIDRGQPALVFPNEAISGNWYEEVALRPSVYYVTSGNRWYIKFDPDKNGPEVVTYASLVPMLRPLHNAPKLTLEYDLSARPSVEPQE